MKQEFISKNAIFRDSFTLVETLVVIAVVSIIALVSVESFSIARNLALLDIGADNLRSEAMRQRQNARVGAAGASSSIFCHGLVFDKTKENQQIMIIKAPYIATLGQKADFCSTGEPVRLGGATSPESKSVEWRASAGDFFIKDIIIGNSTGITRLNLLFKPPFGMPLIGEGDLFYSPYGLEGRALPGQTQLKIILGLRKTFLERDVIVDLQ